MRFAPHFPSFILALSLAGAAAAAPVPPPPPFLPGPTIDVVQGVRIADPYRALEDSADPKVQAWSDAQNIRTRAYLDNLPGRAAVSAKLRSLITAASPSYAGLQAGGGKVFGFFADPTKQQPSIVSLNAAADPASRAIVLDPNVIDPSGHTTIDWFVASPDGTRIAVSLSKNGSEDGVLHIYDVATGRESEAPIDRVQYPTAGGSVAWAPDGQGFWYTRYPGAEVPEAERHFNQQAWFHRLGADPAKDVPALTTADGLPRTAEIFLYNPTGAESALASVQLGDGGQWQHFILRPGARALKVAAYEDRIIAVAQAKDGTLYGVSRKDAPMGKVVKLPAPYVGTFARASLFAPEQADAAIIDGGELGNPLVIVGDRLFVSRIAGGPSKLTAYGPKGEAAEIAIPEVSSVSEVDALPNGDALYRVSTFLEPTYFARWSGSDGGTTRTALAQTSPVSFADTEVRRVFATSKDGTKVPLNIIARKGVKLDGSNPVLLYGYGGYGVNQTPVFAGAFRRLWLDGGGIWVLANIRGGGEYGDIWHRQGMLTQKQNVFDDFAASADWLVKQGYTSKPKLALMGGSNGGLLMGAEITQHPDMARAVVSAVGIYDMIRVELDPNGAFNVSEFGTVKNPDQFKALYAYSPYHNVRRGVAYPAVLMLTGANDGRVNPLHSRKFTAALQAATSSPRPILLRTSQSSGHGIGSSLDERIVEQTDELMFLFDQLGMDAAQAAK
jgi:prolyl oligopeptidase